MFKFLILSFVFFFLIIKVSGFFLRIFLRSATQKATQHFQQQQTRQQYRPSGNANVEVDYVPTETVKGSKITKGGEYVDYEEVK